MEVSKISKIKDLTGQKFGELLVISREHSKNGRAMWLCKCDCGSYTIVKGNKLIDGHTKSCGCLRKRKASMLHKTHGESQTRLYQTWQGIKKRCYNTANKDYKDYGGRGIIVCDEWCNNYLAFKDWAINNGYKDCLTIDRINYNGNYEPNNCRWATQKQQVRNSRHNRYITINNETHCLSEWCEILNLNYRNVLNRVNNLGWSIFEALELKERK